MLRFTALLATLAVCTSLHAQSCESTTPELSAAIDKVHAVREQSIEEAKKVVDEYLPRVVLRLASIHGEIEDSWLHLGIDLSRQLVRLDRKDEARLLLAQIAATESDSRYDEDARNELKKLGE